MDFLTTVFAHRLTIGLRGKIDENFKLPESIDKTLQNNTAISEIVFVLRKIERFNDQGLLKWEKEIATFSDKSYDLTFIECPKDLLIPLLNKRSVSSIKNIRSFVVPYYCSSCNEEFPQLINTSSISLSFSAYSKPACPECEKILSLDITDDEIQRIASLLPVSSEFYEDKRKYPRFDISSEKIKVIVKDDEEKKYEYELINFSEAGLCVRGKSVFDINKKLEILIDYKGASVKSNGSTAWFSKDTPDIYFLGISLENNNLYKILIK